MKLIQFVSINPNFCTKTPKSIWNFVNQSIYDIMTFIDKTISEHRSDTNTDLISAYLSKIQDSQEPNTTFHGQLGMENLKTHLLDLLFAGTETTSTAIMWALLCLMKWPEKQVKMFKEIEDVVGRGKIVWSRSITSLNFHHQMAFLNNGYK